MISARLVPFAAQSNILLPHLAWLRRAILHKSTTDVYFHRGLKSRIWYEARVEPLKHDHFDSVRQCYEFDHAMSLILQDMYVYWLISSLSMCYRARSIAAWSILDIRLHLAAEGWESGSHRYCADIPHFSVIRHASKPHYPGFPAHKSASAGK